MSFKYVLCLLNFIIVFGGQKPNRYWQFYMVQLCVFIFPSFILFEKTLGSMWIFFLWDHQDAWGCTVLFSLHVGSLCFPADPEVLMALASNSPSFLPNLQRKARGEYFRVCSIWIMLGGVYLSLVWEIRNAVWRHELWVRHGRWPGPDLCSAFLQWVRTIGFFLFTGLTVLLQTVAHTLCMYAV